MGLSTYILYGLAFVLLVVSFIKDKNKTKKALKKGWMSFKNIMITLIPLFMFIGIVMTLVTPELIMTIMGEESGIIGVMTALVVGSIAFIPSFLTFPLGADLLAVGAGYPQVAALVTALMAVGIVYIPVEKKFFGGKAVFLRNTFAVLASLVVALVIWVVM